MSLDNTFRYLHEPLYYAQVQTITAMVLQAVERADRDEQPHLSQREQRQRYVIDALIGRLDTEDAAQRHAAALLLAEAHVWGQE